MRALARHRDAALLVGLALAQTFTRGCLTVFVVLISFELLHTGQVGVGILTAVVGAGAVVGSLAALTLVVYSAFLGIMGFDYWLVLGTLG